MMNAQMVASFDTVAEIAKVVRRYVDEETYGKILSDLERVSGSRSFRETIERLRIWERRTRRKEERK
jgi:hypothetical protein